ncbi:MAG: DNA excision repair protein ERCC-3, partial [Pseudohongiellaceae bacterium]
MSADVGSADARPLTVQGDRTILAEVHAPGFAEARDMLPLFAELEKSPEYVHTYRITALSVWNAAASGLTDTAILDFLERFSRYDVPPNVRREIKENIRRFGLLRLERVDTVLLLRSDDDELLERLGHAEGLSQYFDHTVKNDAGLLVIEMQRGEVKQALIRMGYPVEDLAGYTPGAELNFGFRSAMQASQKAFELRPYQQEAASIFHAGGTERGGSGVVVLPCGAGKTIVGMACMERLQTQTLILTTNTIAVRQWRNELLDKTDLTPDQVGEYTGESKVVAPVTISTYQMITYRRRKTGEFTHFALFGARDWGLVVYDEVHLLPAPVFRVTAEIQARRRLGLTATLVREDEREDEVFSLIGPKKYDVPWKILERQGWIADAHCVEVRLPLEVSLNLDYMSAGNRDRFRIASENPAKLAVVATLVARHGDDRVLIIGQYLDQLAILAAELGSPV